MGQVVACVGASLDEIDRVVVVLIDAGRDSEHVGVEDDVFRGEPDRVHQQVVAAFHDGLLAFERIRLAGFIERHDHHCGAVAPTQLGLLNEGRLAFLEADRVDDAFALNALQSGF